jgi:hypothetical protein
MFQALANHGVSAMEIATREGFFKGRGANEGAVKFDAGARRIAGDFEGLGGRGDDEAKKQRSNDRETMKGGLGHGRLPEGSIPKYKTKISNIEIKARRHKGHRSNVVAARLGHSDGRGLLVTRTREDGEAWVFGKTRIGLRELA